MFKPLINHLENEVDWNRFFGICDSLYGDKGFVSRADNFTRSIAIEKAFAACSNLHRVDQTGYDYIFEGKKIELKVKKDLFYVRKPRESKEFKMKNFMSETKTAEDFKEYSTFDLLVVMDMGKKRVVVVEDAEARKRYYPGGDGVFMKLTEGMYYECKMPVVNPVKSSNSLSAEVNAAVDRFIAGF